MSTTRLAKTQTGLSYHNKCCRKRDTSYSKFQVFTVIYYSIECETSTCRLFHKTILKLLGKFKITTNQLTVFDFSIFQYLIFFFSAVSKVYFLHFIFGLVQSYYLINYSGNILIFYCQFIIILIIIIIKKKHILVESGEILSDVV